MKRKAKKDGIPPWIIMGGLLVAFLLTLGAAYKDSDQSLPNAPKTMLAETVMIYNDTGHGSGVIVGQGGHAVLTAGHVARMLDETLGGQVKFSNGKSVPAHTLWISETADVALVLIDDGQDHSDRVATIACRPPVAGEPITLAGDPLMIEQALTFGHVASSTSLSTFHLPRDMDADTLQFFHTHWALDIAAAQGNSGGPLFDADGKVIGLLVAGLPHTGASGLPEFSSFVLMIPSSIFCGMRF